MSETNPLRYVPTPTISIYQNPDYVAGILQQIWNEGLLTSQEQHLDEIHRSTAGGTGSVIGDATGEVKIPALGGIGASAEGTHSDEQSQSSERSRQLQYKYEYSQAFHLYRVRNALRDRRQIKSVGGLADGDGLEVGDIVEFQATFRANEVSALLDILKPDLVSAITYFATRSRIATDYPDGASPEEVRRFAERRETRCRDAADLSRVITEGVRTDFRSVTTREYYGEVGNISEDDAVTAITICDSRYFQVEDEDRLLDGKFTVLGKVTTTLEEDVPILQRNKLLDRIKPEYVDDAARQLRELATNKTPRQALSGDGAPRDLFDLALQSRVQGASFKVIPIAIYV